LVVVACPLGVLPVLRRANMPLRTQGTIGWFSVKPQMTTAWQRT